MVHLEEIKKEAGRLLEEGIVKTVIGYRRGTNGVSSAPAFIRDPGETGTLAWEATCFHNLVRSIARPPAPEGLQTKKPIETPVAIIAKGCDTRAINVLIQEKIIERSDVYIIGVSCEHSGMVDLKKLFKRFKAKKPQRVKFHRDKRFKVITSFGNINVPAQEIMAENCLECTAPYPVDCDKLIGEKIEREPGKPFGSLERLEALPNEERWGYWKEHMDNCIRCFACRSICPMCYCEECVVDPVKFAVTPQTTADEKAAKIKWIERSPLPPENFVYHITRALHLAGRCVDCGECERACPVDIPLRFLNKKMEKDALQLFDYRAGFDPEKPPLISCFKDDDPQEFIK